MKTKDIIYGALALVVVYFLYMKMQSGSASAGNLNASSPNYGASSDSGTTYYNGAPSTSLLSGASSTLSGLFGSSDGGDYSEDSD